MKKNVFRCFVAVSDLEDEEEHGDDDDQVKLSFLTSRVNLSKGNVSNLNLSMLKLSNKICRKAICWKAICWKKDVFKNLNKNMSYCWNIVNATNVVLTTVLKERTSKGLRAKGALSDPQPRGRRCSSALSKIYLSTNCDSTHCTIFKKLGDVSKIPF